ncbi:phage tail tape measure protein [Sutcliffiella horikoshii]|uniref:phage tail tape measure protein n=1 Tax=Sutcliffiella horikoshii TaxID=79883 RepID=UPI001EEE9CAC|nr:phage tail tape measure protein [Sutcliffiella horikoshii]MCG1020780.1 phage tail tape measure protein [Sutcliffiella horikoshii]
MEGRRINISFGVDDRELNKLMNAFKKVETRANQLANRINSISGSFNNLSNSIRTIEDSQKRYTQSMDHITQKNREATKSVQNFQRAVNRGFDARVIDRSANSFSRVDNRIIGARNSMKGLNKYAISFGDSVGIAGERMLAWSISATGIYGTARGIRALISTVVELDSQLIDLQKVMDPKTNFSAMMGDMSNSAKEFGRTLTEVNEVAISFAQQGFDESKIRKLVEATSLLANVGDIDLKQAESTISSLMTVYKKSENEIGSFVDAMNEDTNNFGINVDDLTTAFKKSTGVANAFGVSMSENAGYITAITEATRESGSIVGNSLKTVYSHLTTIPGAIDSLKRVGVDVFNPITGEARDVSDILNELHGSWDNLSNVQQQNIAVQVAGRYQLSRFLGLMKNYDRALEATDKANSSWGSAMEENARYMESLQAKINGVKTAFTDMAGVMKDSGLKEAFGAILISATALLSGVTGLFEMFGSYTWVLGGLAGILLAVSYNFNQLSNNANLAKASIGLASTRTQQLALSMGMSTTTATTLSMAVGRLTMGLKAMALATLTNPLFWVVGAISGVVALVGHLKQVKQQQEEFTRATKDGQDTFESFLEAIKQGTVDDFQISSYKDQLEELSGIQERLNKAVEENAKKVQTQNRSNSIIGVSVKNLTLSQEELKEEYMKTNDVMDILSDSQESMLRAMGLTIEKGVSIADAMEDAKDKKIDFTQAVENAEEALRRQREDAMLPAVDAYYDLSEAIDDTASSMENALGFTNKYLEGLKKHRAIVEILQGVNNLTPGQNAILESSYASLAEHVGKSTEEYKKRPEVIDKELEMMGKVEEIAKKVADGTATNEELKRVQQDLTTINTHKNEREQTRSKIQANIDKLNDMKDYEEQMGWTHSRLEDYLASEAKKAEETAKANKKSSDDSSKSASEKANATQEAQKKVTENLQKELDSASILGAGFHDMASDAEEANGKVESTTATSKDGTTSALETILGKIKDVNLGWSDLREVFKNPIKGIASLSIKAMFGGLFGAGGKLNGDKMKDAVMSVGGGNISGSGYGGLAFTSGFGPRQHPITGKTSFHSGMDLAGPIGTPIRARQGGMVTYSGWLGDYGNTVVVQGANGLEYRYAHNSSNHVSTGQFVPAGSQIASMGSTGMSTGSHLHFEVRRDGVAINPSSYYHNGGIVSKGKKANEVDARLQVGEMVINQSQQKNLFDFLNTNNGNDVYTGMGRPTSNYKIKWGDTLSELAVKFKTSVSELMRMNPSINNSDRIFEGQTIKIPGSSGSSSSAPYFKNKEEAEKYITTGNSIVDHANATGIRNSDYRVRAMTSDKYRNAYEMSGQKYEYNKMVSEELSKFTNANEAKEIFDKANLFMSSADKAKAMQKIMEDIGQNALSEINDKTNEWLTNFNKGVKEGSASVKAMLDISNQIDNRKVTEKKDNYVSAYTSKMLSGLGVAEEVSPEDSMKAQADELKRKIEQRAEESALIQYRLESTHLQPRMNELAGYRAQLQEKMDAIEKDFKSRGINDQSLINEAQQSLKDRLADITAEYNELQYAVENGNKTLADNKTELEGLSEEYKKLQEEIKKAESKREFTDVWGNVVRDAEGNARMITDQGQLIMNTYSQIRKEMESVQDLATSEGGVPTVMAPIIEQLAKAVQAYNPDINTEVNPGTAIVNNSNASVGHTRTYESNGSVNREVHYNVNAGVVLATESEMREFARIIKEMIDEEEGRSQS